MEVLYIPQLDGDDAGESPIAGRYRLLKRVPEGGVVALTDRARRFAVPFETKTTRDADAEVRGPSGDSRRGKRTGDGRRVGKGRGAA